MIVARSWLGSEKGDKVKDVGDGAQETGCGNERRTHQISVPGRFSGRPLGAPHFHRGVDCGAYMWLSVKSTGEALLAHPGWGQWRGREFILQGGK